MTDAALTQVHPEQDLNIKLLMQIHAGYRALLVLLLFTMLLATLQNPIVGSGHPLVFAVTLIFYAFFAIALLLILLIRNNIPQHMILMQFAVDAIVLSAFHFSSGTNDSSLGLLLVITIAASNVILPRQSGLFIAAFATVLVLAGTLFRIVQEELPTPALLPAGLLGIAFFITSAAIQALSERIRATQHLAESQQRDIFQLQAINEQIVQRMRTGVLVLSPDGMIQLMNRAAAELLELPDHSELQLPLPAPAGLLAVSRTKRDAGTLWKPPGSARQLQIGVVSMTDTEPDVTLLFLEDSGKLAARAQELKLASLGRFTASIAHEIRNPLGAISHAAQLLNEPQEGDADSDRLAEIIVHHCQRLNGVIENVLELSRRRATEISEVDLVQWIRHYIDERCNQLDRQANITFSCDADTAVVFLDASQLRQIIDNVVENGLEFSEQHTGKRRIDITLSGGEGSPVVLAITDEGPGIDEHQATRLFEPFFTTKPAGNGLGLYIARELCEANNIKISGGNAATGGAEFRLLFTATEPADLAIGTAT